jgi:hypothetical protein
MVEVHARRYSIGNVGHDRVGKRMLGIFSRHSGGRGQEIDYTELGSFWRRWISKIGIRLMFASLCLCSHFIVNARPFSRY